MTVSVRASLVFSALGMAALTAAFVTPPASKTAETTIAPCHDCELALPPAVSVSAPTAPETEHRVPDSLKDETCMGAGPSCATARESAPLEPRAHSAGPS